jgi:hypothetical protein
MLVKDVHDGKTIAQGSVQIRSNTDRSWSLGFGYMLKHMELVAAASPQRRAEATLGSPLR